jgi:hypothetical protein
MFEEILSSHIVRVIAGSIAQFPETFRGGAAANRSEPHLRPSLLASFTSSTTRDRIVALDSRPTTASPAIAPEVSATANKAAMNFCQCCFKRALRIMSSILPEPC